MIPSKLGWNVDINRGLNTPPPMEYHGGRTYSKGSQSDHDRQKQPMDRHGDG